MGGIGPRGFRTPLLMFEGHVNARSYCDKLENNFIFNHIQAIFGRTFVWQQDNAPSHTTIYTRQYLANKVPQFLPWAPKSPDLSPIEQVWSFIKKKIIRQVFPNQVRTV